MNDLNATVRALDELSAAYARRAGTDGPGHPNTEYNTGQSLRFYVAGQAIADAIAAAAARG